MHCKQRDQCRGSKQEAECTANSVISVVAAAGSIVASRERECGEDLIVNYTNDSGSASAVYMVR